ncbi:MAG: hypothetical protein M1827_003207 [Pycnora praestabilis]|nr:MAG: hypothetical protein M1827_003207 [Pycnora praestabilis]
MNINDPAQSQRGLTNGLGTGGRPAESGPHGNRAAIGMSRAERFEDEKRRIVESCFGKKDTDGSLLESYITHIRIIEDASYPSSPPPPDSAPESKKPRLIIVAVRKSGRVRVHKARENANGTFSIGKTWVLDDLTAIESYTGAPPPDEEAQKRKLWAGGVGFIITIQKPYYWQAGTSKEKEFFIASLVKIYRKYTGGRLPELIGFDPREAEQLVGPPGQQPSSDASNATNTPPPQRPPSGQRTSPQLQRVRRSSQEPRQRFPSQEQPIRSTESREQMERVPGQFPPSGPPPGGIAQSSQNQFRVPRADSPGSTNAMLNGSGQVPIQGQTNLRRIAGQQSAENFRAEHGLGGGRMTPNMSGGRSGPDGVFTQDMKSTSSSSQRAPTPDTNSIPQSLRIGTPPRNGSPNLQPPERIRPIGTPPRNASPAFQPPERVRPAMLDQVNVSEPHDPRTESVEEFSTPMTSPDLRKGEASAPSTASQRSGREEHEIPSGDNAGRVEYFPLPQQLEKPSVEPGQHATPDALDTASASSIERSIVSPPSMNAAAPTLPPKLPTPPLEPLVEPKEEEAHRPGLGPMIKKKSTKDIAITFRKAATAYSAFKPRAGGAGDRIREEKDIVGEGPDGITGVVPAPSLLRGLSQGSTRSGTPDLAVGEKMTMPNPIEEVPQVTISSPIAQAPIHEKPVSFTSTEKSRSPSPTKSSPKPPIAPEARRKKRRSEQTLKNLSALDIHPSLLEDRAIDIESVLSGFGWEGKASRTKTVEILEVEIRREIGRVEAGSWLGHLEQKDDRVEAVEKMLDKTIAECDELEGLLTLYGVELSTLNDDVAFIEAQSQGLQVQTANQKLLHTELEHLLRTISISSLQLQVLREASLGTSEGIEAAEFSLSLLYKAMITIDPALHQGTTRLASRTSEDGTSFAGSVAGYSNNEIGSMRALQEKKEGYRKESIIFVQRLKQYMKMTFGAAFLKTKDVVVKERPGSFAKRSTQLTRKVHDQSRNMLWRYSPLMLFSREIDLLEWDEILRMYEREAKGSYQDEFRENVFAWKRLTKKPVGEELEVLFTTQEKETEGIATTARKMTVKRSATLAKTLRSATDSSGGRSPTDKSQDGRLNPYEAFAGVLDEQVPLIFMEQNFIVDFFHASSLENADFSEAAAANKPGMRRGTDLTTRKLFDPDRSIARRVVQAMDEVFSFWDGDIQNLVDWAIKADALQGVGVLGAIERKLFDLEETNQEYLIRTLQKVHDRLAGLFARFVDEQLRAIEDTKVKIKKRKGVIAFIRTFPNFSTAIEYVLPPLELQQDLNVRDLVNDAYRRITKAMFESLKVIAKESPAVMASQAAQGQAMGDPEDKEALNFHILLIENMNHYVEEVEVRGNPILIEGRRSATQEMNEHMDIYVGAVIRRPLGKLLDYLESTESLLLAVTSPLTIATRASHSRSTFKKLLSTYDSKEIRRGIDTLKKRVEKHFGDADDPGLSRGLVQKVSRECENRYVGVGDRVRKIVDTVYEGQLEIEWRKEDVAAAFRR